MLASIEDLLVEVAWLDGMILVTESQEATFLPVAQVNPVLARLRSKPQGAEVADKLSLSLLKSQGKRASKPVLVVQGDGRFWLGIISPSMSRSRSRHQFPPPVRLTVPFFSPGRPLKLLRMNGLP